MHRFRLPVFTPVVVMFSLLTLLGSASLACGGGGSGGYRKPVRPELFYHRDSGVHSTPASPAQPTSAPQAQTN